MSRRTSGRRAFRKQAKSIPSAFMASWKSGVLCQCYHNDHSVVFVTEIFAPDGSAFTSCPVDALELSTVAAVLLSFSPDCPEDASVLSSCFASSAFCCAAGSALLLLFFEASCSGEGAVSVSDFGCDPSAAPVC